MKMVNVFGVSVDDDITYFTTMFEAERYKKHVLSKADDVVGSHLATNDDGSVTMYMGDTKYVVDSGSMTIPIFENADEVIF